MFPKDFEDAYTLHDIRWSKKNPDLQIRRIKLQTGTKSCYSLVPSTEMPYLVGKTTMVAKCLLLRGYAVPYEVIAKVLGEDSDYWERAEENLARMSIVGSVCKKEESTHLAADEKVTFINGKESYIALMSVQDCVLGAGFSLSEDTVGLQEAYSEFKTEALDVCPVYAPESINLDGWKATNLSWKNLFPSILIVLCFLHSFIKIREISSIRGFVMDCLPTNLRQSLQNGAGKRFDEG